MHVEYNQCLNGAVIHRIHLIKKEKKNIFYNSNIMFEL